MPVSAGTMCGRCLIRPPAYSSTVAALRYEGLAAQLLRRFKFDRDLAAGACLGGLLLARTAGAARPELLVPVPMTPRRLRERGFNQAHELARTVGRRLRIPVDAASARRVTQAMPQSRLPSRRQRRRNVAGVFHVEPRRVDGYHVAVIDDVMTSGATVSALALSLRRGGASRVDVWVACRAGLES